MKLSCCSLPSICLLRSRQAIGGGHTYMLQQVVCCCMPLCPASCAYVQQGGSWLAAVKSLCKLLSMLLHPRAALPCCRARHALWSATGKSMASHAHGHHEASTTCSDQAGHTASVLLLLLLACLPTCPVLCCDKQLCAAGVHGHGRAWGASTVKRRSHQPCTWATTQARQNLRRCTAEAAACGAAHQAQWGSSSWPG